MSDLLCLKPEAEAADLAELATEINSAHREATEFAQTAIEKAIVAGKKLLEAKARCQHGEWLPWLKANVRFDERTARRYMALSANRTRTSDLSSIREALAYLTKRNKALTEMLELLLFAQREYGFDAVMDGVIQPFLDNKEADPDPDPVH